MDNNELRAFEESMKTYQRKDLSGLLNLFSDDTPLEAADTLLSDDDIDSSDVGAPCFQSNQKSSLRGEMIGLTSSVPHPHDPNLFAVRVRRGFAEDLMKQVAVKCLAAKDPRLPCYTPDDLGIVSVFTTGKDAEYIYIEAATKKHLTNALAGLQNIFFSRIEAIPTDQRRKLLISCIKFDSAKPGDFGRLKMFPYRGDICQVVNEVENNRYLVKVIPRMDFLDAEFQTTRKVKKTKRLPQKFFNPLSIKNCTKMPGENESFHWEWNGHLFDNEGYLLLKVSRIQLSTGPSMQKITEEELCKFSVKDEKCTDHTDVVLQRIAYNCGETVKVARGDFQGAVGEVIETVHDRQVVIRLPNMCLTVDRSDVAPFFPVNTEVIVTHGPFAGTIGTVSYINEARNTAFLLCCNESEIEVPMRDLELSDRHITPLPVRPRGILCREHDLVKLVPLLGRTTPDTTVFITRVTANQMMGMFVDGTILNFKAVDVAQKVPSRKATSRDKVGNTIAVGDSVQIDTRRATTAVAHGVLATIKQIYLNHLFLYSEQYIPNAGCFLETADRVLKVGSAAKRQKKSFENPPNFSL